MINKEKNLLKLISEKPWEPSQAKIDNLHDGKTFNIHIGKFGLRYIMVVSTIMFCLLIIKIINSIIPLVIFSTFASHSPF